MTTDNLALDTLNSIRTDGIIDTNKISVKQAFAGKRILVTGTTGFVGKVIVEKLLRDVPDIGGIYLLIRGSKKHPNAHARFTHEIACSSIFERLKIEDPSGFESACDSNNSNERKIHCITGEVTEPQFGLDNKSYNTLAQKIDVIVNSAASVNFREELDQALLINALCLQNTANFSKTAGKIPVLQVSTCYVNGFNKGDMNEENVSPVRKSIPLSEDGFYEVDSLINGLQEKISKLKICYSGDTLKAKLVDLGIAESNRYGWNDTYTFTKWMGEQILRKELRGVPLTILRPAIVESTLIGPVPGWIEGVKVADAILMAYAREKVIFFPGNPNGIIDIIPADLVANSIIIGAAELLHCSANAVEHKIYQCCSSGSNPVTIRHMIDLVQQEADENYQKHTRLFYRKPKLPFVMVSKRVFSAIMSATKLPLSILNRASRMIGGNAQKKTLDNIETAMTLSTVFSFYSEPEYIFHNDQLMALSARISDTDRALFPVDARLIDWDNYMRNIHIPGLDKYALKERKLYQLKAEKDNKKAKAA